MNFQDIEKEWTPFVVALLILVLILWPEILNLPVFDTSATRTPELMQSRATEAARAGYFSFVRAESGDPMRLIRADTTCRENLYGVRELQPDEVDSYNAAIPDASRVTSAEYAEKYNSSMWSIVSSRRDACN